MTFPTLEQRLAQQQLPDGLPVMKQRWAELGFFHWAVSPELITPRLPKGLHVDTFDGKAWIGIVPFLMQRIRPVGLPPLPWLSWFHELNLRTYVYDESGNPGVWFFSLDCNQPIAVEIARRMFHLPYQHASMSSKISDSSVEYHSKRKSHISGDAVYKYPRPTAPGPAIIGSLEWFLVERYTLFSADTKGNIYSGRVHHDPYQIEPMSHGVCSTLPFSLNGFTEPETPPNSLISANSVDVTVYPLKLQG
jgi:uncharacterized protein YqjF (DUF2071 family)